MTCKNIDSTCTTGYTSNATSGRLRERVSWGESQSRTSNGCRIIGPQDDF